MKKLNSDPIGPMKNKRAGREKKKIERSKQRRKTLGLGKNAG